MADEQIIYLSPEEELTNVRERLERISTRRIILVVPTQTQLRSHVSWRLLHARARELNKDILIVSSDRQIRSVVKAAGFKVADSLESPPTSRARPSSRPARSNMGGRTSARLRTPPGKTSPEQRREETRREDITTEKVFPERPQGTLPGGQVKAPPSTFRGDEREFGPDFHFNVGSSASLRPTGSPFEEEEHDHLLEDYQQSQSIRQAAQNDAMLPPHEASPEPMPPIYDLPSASPEHLDEPDGPFTYLDEDQETQLPEQRASAFTSGIDDHVPDIADYPTDDLSIEDDGDQGDFVQRSGAAPQAWSIPAPDEDEDIPGPSRIHGIRPRTNRSGRFVQPPSAGRAPRDVSGSLDSVPQDVDDFEEDDVLPPIDEQPTSTVFPPQTARRSGTLSPSASIGNRPPQPVALPQPRGNAAQTMQPPPRKRPQPSAPSSRSVKRPPVAQPRQTGKKSNRGNIAVILVVVLILLLIGLLGYLLPSADVTVTLPSQSYSLAMKLTANATSHQDVVNKTLPAQTLVFNISAHGTGKATGSTTVGTVQAEGIVYFTNNGTSAVVVPTGTIVATKDNILFITGAEVQIQQGQTLPTDVLAQNPGKNGNVPANTITVIPPNSLTKIQQANPPGTTINLTVTNTDPTQHGGAGNATTVTTGDVNAEKSVLDGQIQQQVKDYLAKNVHDGDQIGKPVQVETTETNPAVDSIANSGTFAETLTLHMTVLVVRSTDLQTAAIAQMKNTLSQQNSAMSLVPQQTVELRQMKNTSAKDGSSIALTFTAWGQVASKISEDTVRNLLSGKRIDEAKTLLNGRNGTPNALNTQITVSPSFFNWVPFSSQRITVHFKTVPQTPPPTPKPKKGKSK